MEKWGLRRWPCAFDWIFSAPEMVTHCLRDDFQSFLDPSEYVALASNKAGHRIYSKMLQRDVIFNHHNPMTKKDYDFFVSQINSLRTLLRQSFGEDELLFLLFNLERRVALKDDAILELFEQLCRDCSWNFELLVLKIKTKSEERREKRLLKLEKKGKRLAVHELHCRGSHDGWRFSNPEDLQALEVPKEKNMIQLR